MSHAWDRALNRWLLTKALREDAKDAIAITTLPIVAPLLNQLPVHRWIYYCVDDFALWPGLSGRVFQSQERELIKRADTVVAASENLAANIRPFHPRVELMTHGVDLDFWGMQMTVAEVPFGDVERPLVIFWGVVDRRMNADWVLQLADAMAQGTVLLVGPQQDPDPRMLAHPRIFAPGPVPIEQLPALAQQASVLIMPYADLPVTRVMQPLKLKEYLATGRPVVAAPLPAVLEWQAFVEITESSGAFVERVLAHLGETGHSEQNRVRDALAGESWEAKAAWFRERVLLS